MIIENDINRENQIIWNNKYSREKPYFTWIVFLLNLSSATYVLGYNQYFFYGVIGATFIALIRTPFSKIINISKNKLFVIFLIFILSLLLSCLYHIEGSLFFTAGGMLCTLLLINYFRIFLDKKILIRILKLYILIQFFLLILSIFLSEFRLIAYQGIFKNPNSTGLVASTGLLSLIPLFHLTKNKLTTKLLAFFVGCFFLFIVISTSSRTSVFISTLGIIFAPFLKGSLLSRKSLTILGLMLISLLILSQTDFFSNAIIYKFLYYAERGNNLNNRSDLWAIAFENPAFFGFGRQSAIDNDIGESIYVAVLYQFGVLSLLLFLLTVFFSIYIQFKNKNALYNDRFCLIVVTLGFAIQGITSSAFGSSLYWLWIFGIGYSIYEVRLEKIDIGRF
ncbi:MAG: hypothetical protein NT094_03575 [Candidatus Staskawiczbacteria bacterium]|nr:hypothetical protein [Candidatus Staskawiczbacteria bacterium]